MVKAGELGMCCNRSLSSDPALQISSSQAVLLNSYTEKLQREMDLAAVKEQEIG